MVLSPLSENRTAGSDPQWSVKRSRGDSGLAKWRPDSRHLRRCHSAISRGSRRGIRNRSPLELPHDSLLSFAKGATMAVAEKTIDVVRLLIVSREPAVLRPLWSIGESNSWRLETAGSGWDALERVQSGIVPHLLLLDIPKGDGDSMHVLRWLRRLRPDLPIILLSYPD